MVSAHGLLSNIHAWATTSGPTLAWQWRALKFSGSRLAELEMKAIIQMPALSAGECDAAFYAISLKRKPQSLYRFGAMSNTLPCTTTKEDLHRITHTLQLSAQDRCTFKNARRMALQEVGIDKVQMRGAHSL